MINMTEFQNHLYLQWSGVFCFFFFWLVFFFSHAKHERIPNWQINDIAKDNQWF